MSTTNDTQSAMALDKKITLLNTIRQEIKKKRIVLDQSRTNFGMDSMKQLSKVKNTSEVKGYPFCIKKRDAGVVKDMKIALKIVPIENKYEKHEHPCFLENIILKELTDNILLKGISPHIVHYLGSQTVSNSCHALRPLNLKRLQIEDKIRNQSNVLISEYVEGSSLDNWVYNTYENKGEISDQQWRNIVFQLTYTIAIMQHYYKMMHNDFHYGNILIDNTIKPGGYFVYHINGKTFYLKNMGIIPKLWDFEFSMAYSDKIKDAYPNVFITGPYKYNRKDHFTIIDPTIENTHDDVPYNYNKVYDLHYFLTSLLDLYISQELFDWIMKIYPEELIPDDESVYTGTDSTDYSSTRESSDSSSRRSSRKSSGGSSRRSGSEKVSSGGVSNDKSDDKSEYKVYTREGRMVNGVEKMFSDIPTPLSLLDDPFFADFTQKPDDFEESRAIHLHSRI